MGIAQQRATCRSCLQAGRLPVGTNGFLKAGGVLIAALIVLLAFLVYLAGG